MNIRLQDYIQEGEKGLSAAVARALNALQSGDSLLLGGETLHFYRQGTQEKYFCISNNDKGVKHIVFLLEAMENVTIDGEGAELIFHGEILPFVIDKCRGLTIKNLNIDYASPMYVQARIENSKKDYFELQFDNIEFHYRERNGKIYIYNEEDQWEKEFCHCLTVEMDPESQCPVPYKLNYITETAEDTDHGFLNSLFKKIQCKDLGNGRLSVSGDVGVEHQNGNYWVGTFHYDRRNPGIFVNASKEITLDNINLYHALAMGVIAQTTENISLRKVRTILRKGSGRLLSVCADSTHFVNCRGKIMITDCVFTNMLDDAVNIHGIYHPIMQKEGEHRICCKVGHFQQAGILSYRPGDEISIVSANLGERMASYTVKEAGWISEEELWLETKETLGEWDDGYVVENLSANPEIEIRGCESGKNRPRGFLLTSPKKTVVENCTFYNMYAGIEIAGGTGGWYESGGVTDVTIRNNMFRNSAFAGSAAIRIKPEFRDKDHMRHLGSGIVIENNCFVQGDKRLLFANAVDGIIFKNNQYLCDPLFPFHGILGEDGVLFQQCEDVLYEPVQKIEK